MSPRSLEGTRIADRWLVGKPIARGGMSTVYRGFDDLEGGLVAIKVLRLDVKPELRSPERFQREARAASRLAHPNVIAIRAHGDLETGQGYLILDYIDGVGLHGAIFYEAPFGVRRALRIAAQIAEALAHAHHHQVLHRDLKPGNILLIHRHDEPDVVQVLDFGLAKIQDFNERDTLTRAGLIFGTPEYMAPEQAVGGAVDGRCDIYALGAILFEMLLGRPPFRGKGAFETLRQQVSEPPPRPSEVRPDLQIPAIVERIVLKCLEKRPENRFSSAAGLARALRAVARGLVLPEVGSESDETVDSQVPTMGGDRAILLDPEDAAQAEHRQLRRHRQETLRRAADLLARHPAAARIAEIRARISDAEQRGLDRGAELAVEVNAHEEARSRALEEISGLRLATIDRQMEATRLRERLAAAGTAAGAEGELGEGLAAVAGEISELENGLAAAERELERQTELFDGRRGELEGRIREVEREIDRWYDELAAVVRESAGPRPGGELGQLLEDLDSFDRWIAANEAILGEAISVRG